MKTPTHRPLRLDHLRTFEVVARRLSFSAAAEELHLTQSAISRQIKSLEDDLGTAVFNRGTRHVELTPAGSALRHTVAQMLDQLDRAVRDIRGRGGRPRVSVSTFASFATLWLMPRLAALGGRVRPLRAGTLDLGEAMFLPAIEGPTTLADREKEAIVRTLDHHEWRLAETAKALGISRTTLWRRLRAYGLHRDGRTKWAPTSSPSL